MEIRTTPRFNKQYKKLSNAIKRKAETREIIFKNNPFDSRLKTHKLHGERKDEWSYSIDYSYRITFLFLNGNAVLYLDVGTHGELY